jgi:hypothetical protein
MKKVLCFTVLALCLTGQKVVPGQPADLLLFDFEEAADLQRQVAFLEDRPNQNLTNSSRPPSGDPPTVKRRPPRPPSGRPPGGQPGHQRQELPFLPPDHTIALWPKECRGWGHSLDGQDPHPPAASGPEADAHPA